MCRQDLNVSFLKGQKYKLQNSVAKISTEVTVSCPCRGAGRRKRGAGSEEQGPAPRSLLHASFSLLPPTCSLLLVSCSLLPATASFSLLPCSLLCVQDKMTKIEEGSKELIGNFLHMFGVDRTVEEIWNSSRLRLARAISPPPSL